MSDPDFLQRIVTELEQAGIPFMVAGSLASGYHGEPRATYDIDLVIDASAEQVELLLNGLSDRCYVSASAALEAVKSRTMFNVVDLQTGIKADFILRKERPFSVTEFGRRRTADIAGVAAFVVSAEDCMLSKLEWAKLGQSERQYRDALKIATVSGLKTLDLAYLERWAKELAVDDLLQRLLREANALN